MADNAETTLNTHGLNTDNSTSDTDLDELGIEFFGICSVDTRKQITITEAVEYAGVSPNPPDETVDDVLSYKSAAVYFETSMELEDGSVVGVIKEAPHADGRRSDVLRPIKLAGSPPPKHSFQVRLSSEIFELLEIDSESPSGERISIMATEGVLILSRPTGSVTISDSFLTTIKNAGSGDIDPLEFNIGSKAADDFRAVEIEQTHPIDVAIERGVTLDNVIKRVRHARKRLKELDNNGWDIEYDLSEQVVPDVYDGGVFDIDIPHQATELSVGQLKAKTMAKLTKTLQENPDKSLIERIKGIVEDDIDTVMENEQHTAESVVESADRRDLIRIMILIDGFD